MITEITDTDILLMGVILFVLFTVWLLTERLRKQIEKQNEKIEHVEWITCRRIEEMVEDTKEFMADGQTQMVANAFIVAERAAAAETANPSRGSARRLSNERELRLIDKMSKPPTKP